MGNELTVPVQGNTFTVSLGLDPGARAERARWAARAQFALHLDSLRSIELEIE